MSKCWHIWRAIWRQFVKFANCAEVHILPGKVKLFLFFVLRLLPIHHNIQFSSATMPPRMGKLPRQFECFSCMSLSYEENWEYLQMMYSKPKVFTNRCNDPLIQRNIPTVLCGTVCVTLLEENVEAGNFTINENQYVTMYLDSEGVFLGYKYIRGCEDRILRHGFNQTALRTHRFIYMDQQCKVLSRTHLFNRPRQTQSAPFYGEVQLCTCFGDKCNGASFALSAYSDGFCRLAVFSIAFASLLISCSVYSTILITFNAIFETANLSLRPARRRADAEHKNSLL